MDGVQLHYVQNMDDVAALLRWLGERRAGIMACDTETTGLNTFTDRIRLAQIGDEMTGWSVPWNLWGGAICDALDRTPNEKLCFHNAKFDISMFRSAGYDVPWRRVHDTRTMGHMLDSARPTGLKALSARYVHAHAAQLSSRLDETMATNRWTWATVPLDFPPYWQYAALDCVLTSRLFGKLHPLMQQARLMTSYETEIAVLAPLAEMEWIGAGVDLPFAAAKRDEMLTYIESVKSWGQSTHDVNPMSNKQLGPRLIELGGPLTNRTPTGQIKVDEDALLTVVAECGPQHPAGQLASSALRARKWQKIVSTHLDHYLDASIDGRIHGSINPQGARTGRMSISNPPLQQLPRADEDNPAAIAVRDCFVAGEGQSLLMVDYDQIELRLATHFAQDPVMLEVIQNPELDPFTEFARRIYQDNTINKKDARRSTTKNAIYAKLYGAGTAKFGMTAGIPLEQAEIFMQTFDQLFPGIKRLQRSVDTTAHQRFKDEGTMYVRTYTGRRVTCFDEDESYKLLNYLIQGTAADVLKRKIVELDLAGLTPFMRLPVHDEIIFEVPDELCADVGAEASRIMRDDSFSIPLPVGLDGPHQRWGDKYR